MEDLRFALRYLRKNPGFAAAAILVLALGIAVGVTLFAFVDAALLRPLPYRDASRLVVAYGTTDSCPECELSYPDYQDWKRSNTVFSSLEAWNASVHLWRSGAGVQAVRSAHVTGGFFRSLGVKAAMGRVFTDADDTPAAPRAAVLPYGTWQSRFGGRPDIVGQSVILDNRPYSVIGVLPREFHFAMRAAEVFTPLHDLGRCEQSRDCRAFEAFGRLRDEVTLQAANAETAAIAAWLQKEHPDTNRGRSARLVPFRDAAVGDIRPTLLVLSSAAGLLLLIAYVNVAGLLLVRAESRKRETVLRGVLGASMGRLARQFVTESVLLVSVATGIGLAVASAAIPQLFNLIPERRLRGMPYFRATGLHWHELWFAAAIALVAVVLFSAAPLMRLSCSNLRGDLAEGGRGSAGTVWKRFGSNLVAVELAIATVLLAGAGLLTQSLYCMLHVPLNFNPVNIATLEVDVQGAGYKTKEQLRTLSRRLLERVSALPGVVAAAHASELPVTCNCHTAAMRVTGQPWYRDREMVLERETSAHYFQVLQAKLLAGRFYTESDDGSRPPVAVINRAFAKRFFPDGDPVGRTIGDAELSPNSLVRVVGVVEDIREGSLVESLAPAVYYPFQQHTDGSLFLSVRTGQAPAQMMAVVAREIQHLDPNLGVRNEFVMSERVNDSPSAFLNRSSAWLVGGFAASALLLGVVGLYGVIAYSVGQRTREIGVRMALGAQRGAIYRLIFGEAALLSAGGIAVGLGCAFPAGALLRGLLFGVQSWDVPTLTSVAVALGACALLGSYLPARRAASVDPVEALRAE